MNLYDILGVRRDATDYEIKKAFINKSKVLHPDAGGGHEEFVELQNAYTILSDPQERAYYDQHGRTRNQKPRVEELAKMLLNAIVTKVLRVGNHNTDIVYLATRETDRRIVEIQKGIRKYEKESEQLKKMRSRCRGDVLLSAIDSRIEGLETQITAKRKEEALVEEIRNIVDECEYEYEKMEMYDEYVKMG